MSRLRALYNRGQQGSAAGALALEPTARGALDFANHSPRPVALCVMLTGGMGEPVIRKEKRSLCFVSPAARQFRRLRAVAVLALAPFALHSQTLLTGDGPGGHVILFNSDLAILEAGDPRSDLACSVTPDRPALGFDLRFHAGYDVSVPLQEFAGSDDVLTILFRVTSQDHQAEPVYFTQRVRVPPIDSDAKGFATLQGAFDLGPGNYHVDWLMRDRSERVCSSSWDSGAVLTNREKTLQPSLAIGAVERSVTEQFQEEPPVRRSPSPSMNVRILINFAPQNSLASTLQPVETSALVSILRGISREPRFGKFSLVAFNMQDQRVIFRQDDADRIDFPALGDALQSIRLGTVDYHKLAEKHSDTEFLASLIRQEAGAGHPDALIFAGPKIMLDSDIPSDSLKKLGDIDFPVFYMNYNRNPQAVPWQDSIGKAVKFFRGYEYTITEPRDLWLAVNEIVTHIVKSRNERSASAISSR